MHGDDTTVRSSPKARPTPAEDGSTCATISRSAAGAAGGVFYYSRDRPASIPRRTWPTTGIFQADAYSGYGKLYEPGRSLAPSSKRPVGSTPGARSSSWPIWPRTRVAKPGQEAGRNLAPGAEAVRRIDALFDIERTINGQSAERRKAVRQELSAPLVADLEAWMREQRAKLSRGNDVAKAMEYMLKRWTAFTRFLDDGRICLSNNAAERALRGIALGRKSWLFAGSTAAESALPHEPHH